MFWSHAVRFSRGFVICNVFDILLIVGSKVVENNNLSLPIYSMLSHCLLYIVHNQKTTQPKGCIV